MRPSYEGITLDRPPGDDDYTEVAAGPPIDRIGTSYDVIAEVYANELADDMVARPLERGMLLGFAELVKAAGAGVVGDVGCGPGHVAHVLATVHGLHTHGVDIAPAMIEQARRRFPAGTFEIGSMLHLPVPAASWIGAVCLYATLHSSAAERARTFRELHRVVRAGGYVLHSFYVSAPDQPAGSIYHLKKWFGHAVDLPTYFLGIEDAAGELDAGGFEVLAALVREPMSVNELPARRCYMIGKRR
jgi:SAM-dependent methyltransferase